MVLRTARGCASSAGRDVAAEGWRISCTQLVVGWSRRSVIPSSGDRVCDWRGVESVCWERVTENPPPTLRDEWAYVGHPLGQPAARSIFVCRIELKWGLVVAALDYMVPARAQDPMFGRRFSWRWQARGGAILSATVFTR